MLSCPHARTWVVREGKADRASPSCSIGMAGYSCCCRATCVTARCHGRRLCRGKPRPTRATASGSDDGGLYFQFGIVGALPRSRHATNGRPGVAAPGRPWASWPYSSCSASRPGSRRSALGAATCYGLGRGVPAPLPHGRRLLHAHVGGRADSGRQRRTGERSLHMNRPPTRQADGRGCLRIPVLGRPRRHCAHEAWRNGSTRRTPPAGVMPIRLMSPAFESVPGARRAGRRTASSPPWRPPRAPRPC